MPFGWWMTTGQTSNRWESFWWIAKAIYYGHLAWDTIWLDDSHWLVEHSGSGCFISFIKAVSHISWWRNTNGELLCPRMNEFATVFVTEEFIENGCLALFPHCQAPYFHIVKPLSFWGIFMRILYQRLLARRNHKHYHQLIQVARRSWRHFF